MCADAGRRIEGVQGANCFEVCIHKFCLVAIYLQVCVRDNNLFGSQYQCKLPLKTQPPSEIAAAAFRSFKKL